MGGYLRAAEEPKAEEVEDTGPKKYSLEEVGKHNSVRDLWLVINDKVYDVTKYATTHPGGFYILL